MTDDREALRLGRFAVTLFAHMQRNGRFVGSASVVWDEGGSARDQPWVFSEEWTSAAAALGHANRMVTKLYVEGELGH